MARAAQGRSPALACAASSEAAARAAKAMERNITDSSTCRPATPSTNSFAACTAPGPHFATSAASWATAPRASSAPSTTRVTRPFSRADSADKTWPKTSMFLAALAHVLLSRCGESVALTKPNLVSEKPKNAVLIAIVASLHTTKPMPSPIAEPLARQIVNCGSIAQASHNLPCNNLPLLILPSGKAPPSNASCPSDSSF
mmetsp:Transcript_30796/g.86353  ORF Transcript_30796/g.86353 Transcript_30796/m.86353 type:complete len:200 (-) Transcript_30796:561-1160(-)